MEKEKRKELNRYLNELFIYLEQQDSLLLRQIRYIGWLNEKFRKTIQDKITDQQIEKNHLTSEEVYRMARDIINEINPEYLKEYDTLLESGRLDFDYEQETADSFMQITRNGNEMTKQINIRREFNYNDVVILIHEFIHYINRKNKFSNVRYYLSEFLSIYFELYATDYLLNRGINSKEISLFKRLHNSYQLSKRIYVYEVVMLAYEKFGEIDENSLSLLQKNYVKIDEHSWEEICNTTYANLKRVEQANQYSLEENPKELGQLLACDCYSYDYRYVLGTILAFYARKYVKLEDVVYLNDHINEYSDRSIHQICSGMGIDLNDEELEDKALKAIEEKIEEYNEYIEKPKVLIKENGGKA